MGSYCRCSYCHAMRAGFKAVKHKKKSVEEILREASKKLEKRGHANP